MIKELEILLDDLKCCVETKHSELLKNRENTILTGNLIKSYRLAIKMFETNCQFYESILISEPDVVERMTNESQRIKSGIKKIGLL
jgi:hypothetical protein